MEEWRQCGRWLIDCKVLPLNHRVVWPSAVVFDLAQALRDGVLLCQMLHNLSPGSVDLKQINFRPQMSQSFGPPVTFDLWQLAVLVDTRGKFLCLKNIRTFLKVCHDKFGLRNSELFDPFDLFDVRDFGKVSYVTYVDCQHSAEAREEPLPSSAKIKRESNQLQISNTYSGPAVMGVQRPCLQQSQNPSAGTVSESVRTESLPAVTSSRQIEMGQPLTEINSPDVAQGYLSH
ncbi:hypothetical protein NFI96_034628, partial [Prochilodus magdalenae]